MHSPETIPSPANGSKKLRRGAMAAMALITATSLTASACNSSGQFRETPPNLRFNADPETNFSATDCNRHSESWAVFYDRPSDTGEHTLGFYPESYQEGDKPRFIAGATVNKIGAFVYEVATSDGTPAITTDISQGPYSRVFEGERGKYDLVVTGRLESKNPSEEDQDTVIAWKVDCLPNFGFAPNAVPAIPLPTPPEQTEPARIS